MPCTAPLLNPLKTHSRWTLLFIVLSCYLMGFIIRFAWPALAPIAAPDLGMSIGQSGSYVSAFYIGYVAMHIPAGVLGDRFGVKLLITISLVLEGMTTFFLGTIEDAAMGFALRVCAGLGAGALFAATVSCITHWFAPKERGIAFGLMMVAPTGGGVLLPNLLMPHLASFWGWRGAFMAIGSVALLLAMAAYFLLPCEKRNNEEKQSFLAGLRYVTKQKNVLLVSLAGWGMMWGMVGFISFSNSYMEHTGLSLTEASFVMSAFGLAGIAGPLIAGWLTANKTSPKRLMGISLILLVPVLLAFGSISSFSSFLLTGALAGLLFGLANPPLPLLVSLFSDKEWAGTAGGVAGCIFQSASIVAPLAVGMTFDMFQKPLWPFSVMAIGLIGGALILTLIPSSPETHGVDKQ